MTVIAAKIARRMIREGKAQATSLVRHTNGVGAEISYIALTNFAAQRTDHYRVADGHISEDQLAAEDRALLVSA